MTYDEQRLLRKSIYIINQLSIAFDESERRLTRNFERVKENARSDMVRLHLPHYLHGDSKKLIEFYTHWESSQGSPGSASVPDWVAKEVKATWQAARDAGGELEAFRIIERMVDRLGYGRIMNNPSLASTVQTKIPEQGSPVLLRKQIGDKVK